MQECWAHSPDLRPTFSALVNKSVFKIRILIIIDVFVIRISIVNTPLMHSLKMLKKFKKPKYANFIFIIADNKIRKNLE